MAGASIGIDLGTSNLLIYVKNRGIVLQEPSVVAIDRYSEKILSVGTEAKDMIGRTPGNILAIPPIKEGVISEYDLTEFMIKFFISKVLSKSGLFRMKPLVAICVPSSVTEVEKKAVEDATRRAGARDVYIIEEPLAAAIGAGIDISKACGSMVVDIGGGTTDIGVISLGASVKSLSVKVAGNDFDEAIIRYIRKKHNLLIGDQTAENLKIQIGTAHIDIKLKTKEVRGRDLLTGLPKSIIVTSEDMLEALSEPVKLVLEAIHSVLEITPPELVSDIYDRGIIMSGGGSLLNGLDKVISERTGINVLVVDEALNCVVLGTGKYVEYLEENRYNIKVGGY